MNHICGLNCGVCDTHLRAHQCIECGSICASAGDLEFHINRYHPVRMHEPYTPRANTVAEIVEALPELSDSEIEILAEVVRGVRAGRKEHGTLDLATDTRDYGEELWQEVRDGLFYIAARTVKARRGK